MADRILKPDSGNDLVLQNDDASAKIEINEDGSIPVTGTITGSVDVSSGTFTTSSAQKQAIVQAGPGSGTLDVSSGTLTTSTSQKDGIVDGSTAISRSGNNLTFAGTVGNTGDNTITSGNLVIGTAGKGIDFSAQTTSSTGTPDTSAGAEVLDHYEKGSFTPNYTGQTGQSYVSRQGRYTKIGDVCFFGVVIQTSSMSGTNAVKITCLPFSSNGQAHDCGVCITSIYGVNFDTGRTFMGADLTGSGTEVSLYQLGHSLPNTSITADLLASSAVILQLGGWYRCA